MARKMNVKFEKYWGEVNLLMGIAAVLDPRYKITPIRFCYPIIYREPNATRNFNCLLSVFNELYNDYVGDYNSSVME
jgi:hypothetical protein